MVACTLDYKWRHYVIAALVSLFVGVVILLPVKIWQVLEHRRRQRLARRPTTAVAIGLRSTLGRMRTYAESMLAGNSTCNKIYVSSSYVVTTSQNNLLVIFIVPLFSTVCETIFLRNENVM